MRVFALSVIAAVLVAAGGYVLLDSFQESTAVAYTTGSARLDWQEQSNSYGFAEREPKRAQR